MLRTPLTELLGCRAPVQQAPMGTVSSPELAVAVAEAGGIGTITALGIEPRQLEELLAKMAAGTDGVLAANFLTADVDLEALEAAARRLRLVDFFWSDPDPALVQVAHDGGALVCWQVGSVEEARAAVDAGCDMVAVQGIEAGGHVRGYAPLIPLLGAVLDAVNVPVLAAGGVADGRGLAAVLAAGASGARMGTRFIAAEESGAHVRYKQAVVDAGFGSTEITAAFNVCPLCATSPRARVLRSCVQASEVLADEFVGEAVLGGETVQLPKGAGLPPGATARGSIEAMAMYAGESAALVDRVRPAAGIVADVVTTAERLLGAWR